MTETAHIETDTERIARLESLFTERIAKLESLLSEETGKVTALQAQNSKLKEAISKVSTMSQSAIEEIKAEMGRVSKSWSDRVTQTSNIALANEEKIKNIQTQISGDGDQEIGIRNKIKEIEADTSEFKLDKRDKKTTRQLFTTAWSFGGAILFSLVIASLKGIIDEKAKTATGIQEDNKKEFVAIKGKLDENSKIFYARITELEKAKSAIDRDLFWITSKLK